MKPHLSRKWWRIFTWEKYVEYIILRTLLCARLLNDLNTIRVGGVTIYWVWGIVKILQVNAVSLTWFGVLNDTSFLARGYHSQFCKKGDHEGIAMMIALISAVAKSFCYKNTLKLTASTQGQVCFRMIGFMYGPCFTWSQIYSSHGKQGATHSHSSMRFLKGLFPQEFVNLREGSLMLMITEQLATQCWQASRNCQALSMQKESDTKLQAT
jgi:hypothetical protein